MKLKKRITAAVAFCVAAGICAALPACSVAPKQTELPAPPPEVHLPDHEENIEHNEEGEEPQTPVTVQVPKPQPRVAQYVVALSDGVNIRTGAGTGYGVLGGTEKGTLYASLGGSGGWYKTAYKNSEAYISKSYCKVCEIAQSEDGRVERVISEGCKLLGVKYVYGATRYHDGSGKRLGGFTVNAFDCSSLMQYIFKIGAGVNLQLTTRTQVYQGKEVKRADIKRGDLLFFTNSSRVNNKGVERVGHVALYLGDNYILHTTSDYAKIEQITAQRWGYFLQARRVL